MSQIVRHIYCNKTGGFDSISCKYPVVYCCGIFRRASKIAKNEYYLHHVCPSICMEQLDSRGLYIHGV